MKLINSSVKIMPQDNTLDGVYKQIEMAGRTCYKSEDKITSDSAKEFVNKMINSKHYAMLEFGTVYLCLKPAYKPAWCQNGISITDDDFIAEYYNTTIEKATVLEEQYEDLIAAKIFYNANKFTKVKIVGVLTYITTNYRVLVENDRLKDLQFMCKPTQFHEKRICAKFITDRGVSHELVRHKQLCVA